MNIKQSYGLTKQHCYLALLVFIMGVIVYVVQVNTLFNPDMASLLFDTELFLSGGTYVKDFFETNPPMIFILYTPIVLFQKWTMLDVSVVADGYVVMLSWVSLFFCYTLLQKIIDDDDFRLRYALLAALFFCYLMLTIIDFGQREHFLLILGAPYLFSVVVRAQNKPIQPLLAVIIGFMAGLVFSLKPFFLIPLALIEIYLIVNNKNIWAWVRVEFLLLASVMIAYLVFAYTFHPLYFNTMLPLLKHWYFLGTKEAWTDLLRRPKVLFCLMIIVYYVAFYTKSSYRELTQVLLLALVGLILAFIVPRSAWGYHVLPAYSVALMLCVIFTYQAWSFEIKQHLLNIKDLMFILAASFAMPFVIYMLEVEMVVTIMRSEIPVQLYGKVKTVPHNSIYCFSSITTGLCFPFVSLNNVEFAGRFPSFWWLHGIRIIESTYKQENFPRYFVKEKKYFIDAIADDLNHYQPKLIIASTIEEEVFLPKGHTYPMYFSENEKFREAWSHYAWFANVSGFALYTRSV